MSTRIIPTLRSKPPAEQARLIGNMRNYITDFNLINLMNSYDINSNRSDKMLQGQLYSFDTVPGLNEQIKAWLSSQKEMCCNNGSKRFFVLLLNSQKIARIPPKSLEVFKQPPDLLKVVEWATKLNVKNLKDLQVVPIDIPYSRLIQ